MKVIFVKPLERNCLEVHFEDGLRGTIPIKDLLTGPIFQPLQDESFFKQVFLDEFHVVSWPNGADLDPYSLRQRVLGTQLKTENSSSEVISR